MKEYESPRVEFVCFKTEDILWSIPVLPFSVNDNNQEKKRIFTE